MSERTFVVRWLPTCAFLAAASATAQCPADRARLGANGESARCLRARARPRDDYSAASRPPTRGDPGAHGGTDAARSAHIRAGPSVDGSATRNPPAPSPQGAHGGTEVARGAPVRAAPNFDRSSSRRPPTCAASGADGGTEHSRRALGRAASSSESGAAQRPLARAGPTATATAPTSARPPFLALAPLCAPSAFPAAQRSSAPMTALPGACPPERTKAPGVALSTAPPPSLDPASLDASGVTGLVIPGATPVATGSSVGVAQHFPYAPAPWKLASESRIVPQSWPSLDPATG